MAYPLALFERITGWTRLPTAEQLFFGIGIVAGIVTLLVAVLGLFGFDHHGRIVAKPRTVSRAAVTFPPSH